MSDYFRMNEAEQFTFFRIPKILFTDRKYTSLSTDARVLYGVLLDRMGMSLDNGWVDENGRAYIYYRVEQLSEILGFGRDKIRRLFLELEKVDLLERKKQGLQKPDMLYLKKFVSDDAKYAVQSTQNASSGVRKNRHPEDAFCPPNNIKKNNNEINNIYPSIDQMDREIREKICYEVLVEDGYAVDLLNELIQVMIEVFCTTAKTIRVGRNDFQTEVVQQRLWQLDMIHMQYVMDSFQKNTTKIRNIKAYLLAALFNAPVTMGHYYQSAVNHDFYGG